MPSLWKGDKIEIKSWVSSLRKKQNPNLKLLFVSRVCRLCRIPEFVFSVSLVYLSYSCPQLA